ncbi:hypothetical protein [Streptosporangium sp. NPDC051022]|uniref:hypothetical protein n=1 Tax=Streptosporangium sp. NPDC051022 TaxID=3155752 RepID=UPI003419F5BE
MAHLDDPDAAAAQASVDRVAFERAAPAPVRSAELATGYIRAERPEDGTPVTFVPGERLPAWVAERLRTGQATYDPDSGAWTLITPPAEPSERPERRKRTGTSRAQEV